MDDDLINSYLQQLDDEDSQVRINAINQLGETGNKNIYGALYNWYSVSTGKICPSGWHVPTRDEWIILVNNAGGESVAAERLKESGTSHWESSNSGVTNETNFTALPAGNRGNSCIL